jgi:hypothetical protein
MGSVRIAHISDPHFGSENQAEVWRSVRDYLNGTITPHLVLVTGDIVHTPDQALYLQAQNELDHLKVVDPNQTDSYRVCAGNHDRHPWGNAPGRLQTFYQKVAPWRSHPASFDQKFVGRIPTVESPHDFLLSAGGIDWKIRVMAFDTSADAKFLAQGIARNSDIQSLAKAASSKKDADLVILMHHHHLLSISELEKSRQRLKNLFSPTVMLNAGTVLEALAQGSVNLVLHGHEHFRMFARYGTLYGQQNDTVVLGAGSVTGNDSIEGCDIRRASFNVIELRRDRSVHVQEIINDGIRWKPANPPVLLLDGQVIRRSRFNRRVGPSSSPTSNIVKSIEFNADRTVDLTQTWSNWVLKGGRWAHITTNSSGLPSRADVRFDWSRGEPNEFHDLQFVLDRDFNDTYRLELPLDRGELSLARKIRLRFRWLGGAMLTKNDLEYFDQVKLDEFRRDKKEFWAIHTADELQSMSLLIRLPPLFAPKPEDIEVYSQPLGSSSGNINRMQELEAAIQHHATGLFSLQISYPWPNFRYSVTWPLPDGPQSSPTAERFRTVARDKDKAVHMLEAYAGVLGRFSIARASLGLYIPSEDPTVLVKTGKFRRGYGHPELEVPRSLSLRNDNVLHRQAWWGQVQAALRQNGDREFVVGERAIIIVPIRHFGRETDETWGVIRIGIPAEGGPSDADLQTAFEPDRLKIFAEGLPMMLPSTT